MLPASAKKPRESVVTSPDLGLAIEGRNRDIVSSAAGSAADQLRAKKKSP
jgi:hypothetical protein